MGDTTKIAWTADAQGNPGSTFSPWVGCTKVSEGCAHCYAADYDKRVGGVPIGQRADKTKPLLRWGPGAPRTRTSAAYWRKPLAWNREAEKSGVRRKVFCASLCDVFDPEVPIEWLHELQGLIAQTPALDWLVLTKRPENFGRWHGPFDGNVWLGVTVENQEQAEKRIPLLLAQDAAVRFLSVEPLLEKVTLWDLLEPTGNFRTHNGKRQLEAKANRSSGIGWVIVGGESGPKARPLDLAWARSIRDQCKAAQVPYFFKQAGAAPILKGDDLPDSLFRDLDANGYQADEIERAGEEGRLQLRDSHGGDLAELPEDLRIRDFPTLTPRSTT